MQYGLLLLSTLLCHQAAAQSKQLTGTVRSAEDDAVLPGVAILIEGNAKGTITDINGAFSLEVMEEDVLIISYLGYETQKITVGSRSVLNVSLNLDLKTLEEIVVVGYGSVKKSDLTGSVSTVKSQDITAYPILSATQALQGRAAGVQIQSNNGGQPGSDLSVRIRGGTSINATSDPIFVVDGFVGAELPPPEDIASIEVLKDASATAIYGSRGANGVIMVTTKRGQNGPVTIDFNSSYSIQQTTNSLDLLGGEDFANYQQEFGDYAFQGSNTDWQDIIFQQGFIANNQLSLRGGSEDIKFYVGGTYYDQEGIVVGSDYNRYSFNSNVDIEATEKLKVGVSLYARRSETNGVRTQEGSGGSGQAGVIGSSFRFNPDLGVFNDDGTLTRSFLGGEIDNPYALATEYQRERITDRFQANVYGEMKILEWLSFKSTLGIGTTNWREGEFWPTTLVFGEDAQGTVDLETRKLSSFLSENYFTINKNYDSHEITWITGYSFQKDTREDIETSNSGFVSNSGSFWALDQGSNPGTPVSNYSETIIKSYYSRVNYSAFGKYKLTFTTRFDGASNFSENNKWAFFPSAAVAWNIVEEPFMESLDFLSELKLRTSYGLVGNQAIPAYGSLATLDPTYSIVPGQNALRVGELENSQLTWETTSQLDIGLDIGLLDGRLFLSADYYDKETSDLLFERQLPGYVGVANQVQNIGTNQNRGFEFTINSKNMVGDFSWSTDFIFSSNRNKVLSLPDSVEFYGENPGHLTLDDNSQLLLEGQPIGVFYGYVYDGIYQNGDTFIPGTGFEQEAGGERFKDISGPNGVPDGVLDANDRTIIGDPNPDFTWSLNNTFQYKNFDLNIFIQGVHGNDMLSYTLMELETFSGNSNVTAKALNRWRPENPNTDVPKANSSRSFRVSDRFIYDASYIRLKNLVIGYTLPKAILDKINIRKLRVYASAQNIYTLTDYPGLDPEVGYENAGNSQDGNRNLGLDYASYPNVKSYTFGINLGF